jgi:hypothetical protein
MHLLIYFVLMIYKINFYLLDLDMIHHILNHLITFFFLKINSFFNYVKITNFFFQYFLCFIKPFEIIINYKFKKKYYIYLSYNHYLLSLN